MNRFTYRGKDKVNTQWLLYCLVYNLEKIARNGLLWLEKAVRSTDEYLRKLFMRPIGAFRLALHAILHLSRLTPSN
jgi:hypothetical protein